MDYLDARLSTPGASSSRSSSPDSSVTTNASFIRASNTIDDLTRALASFSRGNSVGAPDVPTMTVCCCGREDCQAALSWGHERAKLEKDLELSAGMHVILLSQRRESTNVTCLASKLQRLVKHCSNGTRPTFAVRTISSVFVD